MVSLVFIRVESRLVFSPPASSLLGTTQFYVKTSVLDYVLILYETLLFLYESYLIGAYVSL